MGLQVSDGHQLGQGGGGEVPLGGLGHHSEGGGGEGVESLLVDLEPAGQGREGEESSDEGNVLRDH